MFSRFPHRSRVAVWLRSRPVAFICVGSAAAAVHAAVVVALVSGFHWPPLLANVLGWLIAFGVSFTGHHRLSFRDHRVPAAQALRRFFLISLCGFVINESAYALLLRWSQQRYDVLLAIVLVGTALVTYVLSRFWAFRARSTADE